MQANPNKPSPRSEFLRSAGHGVVLGSVVLLGALLWMRGQQGAEPAAAAPAPAPAAAPAAAARPAGPLADFGGETPSPDARHVANWAFFTGDPQGRAVVILDKREARVYTFGPDARLLASTPVLLGSALGDEAAPGIGDKPLAQILPEEKTTHAGRFVLQPGMNTDGEDVLWVDYGAALSMHRVRTTNAAERRLERLASPTIGDNRISYGCINVPPDFYDATLKPLVARSGAVVYVLPETRSPQEVFGSWDVTDPHAVARAPLRAGGASSVALGSAPQPKATR